eukprot:491297_1
MAGRRHCRFFNTPNGCRYGYRCHFLHTVPKRKPICKYFNTKNGCIHGTNCYYRHQKQYQTQSNQPMTTFESNKTKLTNSENKQDIVLNLDRKTSTEYLIFGECRKHYNIIPPDIANIIIKYYFIKYHYLALFHCRSKQIMYFGIDPIVRDTKNIKKKIIFRSKKKYFIKKNIIRSIA